MFELPTSIHINGKDYPIRNRGDYRMVLDCFNALNDSELDKTARVLTSLIIFYEDVSDVDDIELVFGDDVGTAVNEMYLFFNCNQPDGIGAKKNYRLIDWENDAQLVASAINNVARTEVRLLEYLHWWTFMGYYLAIGESPLSTVVSIRDKIKSHKKLEDYEKEFRRNNPQYFIWNANKVEDTELEDYIREMWNSGG